MRSIERKRPAEWFNLSNFISDRLKLAVDVVDSTPYAVYLTPVGHSEVTHMLRFHISLKWLNPYASPLTDTVPLGCVSFK